MDLTIRGVKVTKEQFDLHNDIEEARDKLADAQKKFYALLHLCQHVVMQTSTESAVCVICRERLGWWCPKSSTHLCEYKDDEWCVHCHQPSERK